MKFLTGPQAKYIVEDAGDRILSQKDVLEMLPISKSTLMRMRNRGDFPPPFKVSPRKNGWMESEIISWIANVQEGNVKLRG